MNATTHPEQDTNTGAVADTVPATTVLAFVDGSSLDRPVTDAARSLARRLGAAVQMVRVVERVEPDPRAGGRRSATRAAPDRREGDVWREVSGPVVPAIVGELEDANVAAGVLGARRRRDRDRPLGHVALDVVTSVAAPLVVVPPDSRPLRPGALRLLLPLDDDQRTADTVSQALAPLISRLGDLIPVHVYGREAAPMFVTSPEDRAVLADEFAARRLPALDEPVHLRLGHPASQILAACQEHRVDAVVVCWKQQMTTGHADVVRGLLEDGTVPIVLLPHGHATRV